jgi:hypothetical protein
MQRLLIRLLQLRLVPPETVETAHVYIIFDLGITILFLLGKYFVEASTMDDICTSRVLFD